MVTQTAGEILEKQVAFSLEGIDRMYLNVYQPHLQNSFGIHRFFVDHRKQRVASPILMSKITHGFVADLQKFILR